MFQHKYFHTHVVVANSIIQIIMPSRPISLSVDFISNFLWRIISLSIMSKVTKNDKKCACNWLQKSMIGFANFANAKVVLSRNVAEALKNQHLF